MVLLLKMCVLITMFIGLFGLFALQQHANYMRDLNDQIYLHTELSPINKIQLQSYKQIYNQENPVEKTVREIYVGVKKSAAGGKPGYWHSVIGNSLNKASFPSDVITQLKTVFPDCHMEYSSRMYAIGVFWHNYTLKDI